MAQRRAEFDAAMRKPLNDQELDAALRAAFERGAKAARDEIAAWLDDDRPRSVRYSSVAEAVRHLPLPEYQP